MSYERRPDRRPGGRPGGGRPDRGGPRDRGGYGDRPPRDRGGYGGQAPDRPPRDRPAFGDRPAFDRPPRPPVRSREDEGGMSIRLDPRRLAALKLLAAEAGIRPGELVTAWVEERLDAARAGRPAPQAGGAAPSRALDELAARVDQLTRRLDAMAAEGRTGAEPAARADASGADATAPGTDATPPAAEETAPEPQRRRPGRPRKQPAGEEQPAAEAATPRVPLHEEIVAVIRERGPMTAGEIASAIAERGRYSAPRSNRPLDAATVNSRVSNPAYRALFVRSEGRVGLA